ncbi:hypothetical protein [Solilutibacter pythonis]|nr:hypothetical protein [Lysobacter pythonis]
MQCVLKEKQPRLRSSGIALAGNRTKHRQWLFRLIQAAAPVPI